MEIVKHLVVRHLARHRQPHVRPSSAQHRLNKRANCSLSLNIVVLRHFCFCSHLASFVVILLNRLTDHEFLIPFWAAAWMTLSMCNSLAYILGRVCRGFSCVLRSENSVFTTAPTDCDDEPNHRAEVAALLGRRLLCGLAASSGFMVNFRHYFTSHDDDLFVFKQPNTNN